MERIIILGCGGHAHSAIDSIKAGKQYEIVGVIGKKMDEAFRYNGYAMIGTDDRLEELYDQGVHNAFVGIGFLGKEIIREKLYFRLKEIGFRLPFIIDPTAVVAENAVIQEGAFVAKKTVINAMATIGKMAIINTGAIVEHDVRVGDFSHVAVSAVICGEASVGMRCMVGANSTVLQCKKLGNGVVVGAGSVVTKDVEDNMTWIGTNVRGGGV